MSTGGTCSAGSSTSTTGLRRDRIWVSDPHGLEVARFACDMGGVLAPRRAGVPDLPWDVQVIDQRSGASTLVTRITELPKPDGGLL